ncbi:hypothetical protein [Carnimonas bestiolae]|uniref:hypothetical protein n=1 Tax=Carnimonas bestiolae TaxID=3402172 RepID=UPI003EDBCCAD
MGVGLRIKNKSNYITVDNNFTNLFLKESFSKTFKGSASFSLKNPITSTKGIPVILAVRCSSGPGGGQALPVIDVKGNQLICEKINLLSTLKSGSIISDYDYDQTTLEVDVYCHFGNADYTLYNDNIGIVLRNEESGEVIFDSRKVMMRLGEVKWENFFWYEWQQHDVHDSAADTAKVTATVKAGEKACHFPFTSTVAISRSTGGGWTGNSTYSSPFAYHNNDGTNTIAMSAYAISIGDPYGISPYEAASYANPVGGAWFTLKDPRI